MILHVKSDPAYASQRPARNLSLCSQLEDEGCHSHLQDSPAPQMGFEITYSQISYRASAYTSESSLQLQVGMTGRRARVSLYISQVTEKTEWWARSCQSQ